MTDASLRPADAAPANRGTRRRFYFAVWRWHFYAGLFTLPFLVILALTGLLMLWVSVLDGREGEKRFTVEPAGEPVAIALQGNAALAAVPEGTLKHYMAPLTPEHAALFRVAQGKEERLVAIDPYRGEALDSWQYRAGWYDWATNLHGSLLLGDVGDAVLEVAAGFGIILVVTGLYLWWPREPGGLRRMLLPNLRAPGRAVWKSLHGTVGLYASALLVFFLLSGMTWTGFWGERITQAWSTFPAAKWNAVPLSEANHDEHLNHGATKGVPWAIEQTPVPLSGSTGGAHGVPAGTPVTIDSVAALARSLGFAGRIQVSFPADETSVWTISQDSISKDTPDPTADRTVHVDQYSGKVLASVAFADYSLPGKAMAVGIAVHEGNMGLWNVALNTVFCLGVVFLALSGAVMWWRRRPRGVARLAAPPPPTAGWGTATVLMLTLSLAFPLTGFVLVTVLVLDAFLIQNVRPLAKLLS